MALNEEYVYDADGEMRNASFLDYRMPTSLDLPEIETILVEVPNPGHPYGVRGVGEVPIVPPLAAVANAIYDALASACASCPPRLPSSSKPCSTMRPRAVGAPACPNEKRLHQSGGAFFGWRGGSPRPSKTAVADGQGP